MANARLTQYMTLKGLMVATDLLSMISMVIGCIDEKYLLFGARLLIGFSVGLNAMTVLRCIKPRSLRITGNSLLWNCGNQ
jgi:hypothetical protein